MPKPRSVGLPVDQVVGACGACCTRRCSSTPQQQTVRGLSGIVEQAEVRRRLLELAVDAQDQAAEAVVIRADVDVHEGVRQHPVQVDPEGPLQLAMEGLVIQFADEGQQQLIGVGSSQTGIPVTEGMVIEDAQGVEGLIEIPLAAPAPASRALAQELFIVRQHIARLGACPSNMSQHPRAMASWTVAGSRDRG